MGGWPLFENGRLPAVCCLACCGSEALCCAVKECGAVWKLGCHGCQALFENGRQWLVYSPGLWLGAVVHAGGQGVTAVHLLTWLQVHGAHGCKLKWLWKCVRNR
jgi:hypothetical protein